jgi:hypothetical protein
MSEPIDYSSLSSLELAVRLFSDRGYEEAKVVAQELLRFCREVEQNNRPSRRSATSRRSNKESKDGWESFGNPV